MKTKTRGGIAAIAAMTMAGGLLPFFAVGVASAAEPTAISVAPSAAFAAQGGTATFQVSQINGAGARGIFYTVLSGPDAASTNPLLGTACGFAGTNPATCTITNGGTAGVDNIRFFYDGAGTGSYVPSDASVSGTLTVGDATKINSAIVTPSPSHVGLGAYTMFTVAVNDSLGRPVTGTPVTLAASGTATNTDVQATTTQPAGPFTGVGTGTATVNSVDGVATFYVASKVVGSVTLTASAGTPVVSSTSVLTVASATANDATSVVVTPATQKAFSPGRALVNIKVTNAQGDPIVGVVPVISVTGPDAPATPGSTGTPFGTVSATDANGVAVATYPTLTNAVGTDTVTAYINQTNHTVNTYGQDTGEPSGNATVSVGLEHFETNALTNTGAVTVPVAVPSAPLTFKLKTNDGSDPSGYTVLFTVNGAPGKYSLSAANGTTDANGNITVTVTNSAPAGGDVATVTATLLGDAGITSSTTATWVNQSAANPVIAPFANTAPTKGSTTHTVTLTDALGNPVPGVTYTWLVQGRNDATVNTGATGVGSSFTYTDSGPLNVDGQDTITVTASNSSGVLGTDTVNQFWVTGTAQAAQAAIDAQPYGAFFAQGVTNGPFVPVGFDATANVGVTSDPTQAVPVVAPHAVAVKVIDANGNPLYGKSVSFTSSGVGGFTDSNGKPIGSSVTALVSDGSGANGEGPGQVVGSGVGAGPAGYATVYVRSTNSGVQTIVATVDGITNTAKITYTGQYVPVEPDRVLDSRTGQGSLTTFGFYGGFGGTGTSAANGQLSPNTVYYFPFSSTDMPLNAAAYAFNVTAISPSGVGNLRVVSACESSHTINPQVPTTSLVNYQPGKDVANFTVIANQNEGFCGGLKIYSANSSVAVAIDLVGYYPDNTGIASIPSTRLVDTRIGLGGGTGNVPANSSRSFQITGTDIPAGTKSVALNVTAINPQGLGNLRVYPDGATTPNASNINYIPGVDKSAFVIVNLPANGKIDVYSAGVAVDVAIDAYAYYPTTSTMVTFAPTRILDTRSGGSLVANTAKNIPVAGLAGVPADALAVLVSVTAIHKSTSTGIGNLRVYPAGGATPNVSTLNYVSKTADVANFAIVKLGANGQIALYTAGSPTDVAVDVVGYIPAGSGDISTN